MDIKEIESLFGELADCLAPINTWYRNYPDYLKNRFNKIISEQNKEIRLKKIQLLIAYLDKLSINPKIKDLSASEIITERLNKVIEGSSTESHEVGELDKSSTIIATLKHLLGIYSSEKMALSGQDADITPVHPNKSIGLSGAIDAPFETIPEVSSQHQDTLTGNKVTNILRDKGAKISSSIQSLRKKLKNSRTISVTSPEIASLSEENKDIAQSIINLKFMLKAKECFEAQKATEELRKLLKCYLNLCAKTDLSKEEVIMLQLLTRYRPLDILRKLGKKYEGEIDVDTILSEFDIKKTLDKLLGYNAESSISEFNSEYIIDSQVLELTQLMEIEEIVSLYKKYRDSLLNNDSKNIGKLQDIFAEAIRCNPNYSFLIRIPDRNGNLDIERIMICAEYFQEFKVAHENQADIENFIKMEVSHPLLAEMIIQYLAPMYENLRLAPYRTSVLRAA